MTRTFLIYLLLSVSFLIVLWINFFPSFHLEPWWEFSGAVMNKILERLSLAYISAFIFYLIVIKMKEVSERKQMMPFIADHSYVMMNNIRYFAASLRTRGDGFYNNDFATSIHNRNNEVFPNHDEINRYCNLINPNELNQDDDRLPAGFVRVPTFFGLMIKYSLKVDYFLGILLQKSTYMDAELVRILTDIKTSGYHETLCSYGYEGVMNATHRHDHLVVYIDSFNHYFDLIRKLEDYAENKLKKYVERDSLKVPE